MKPLTTFYIISVILVTLFFSCSLDEKINCKPQKTLYAYIDGKSAIPYNGLDTLKFIRTNLGDTHTFIGTGFNNDFNSGSINLDYNCPNDKTKLEYISISFGSPNLNDSIYYKVNIRSYYDAPHLLISFKRQDFEDILDGVLYSPVLYDSLNIAGHWYYDIHYITNTAHDPPNTFYILYNKLGVLRIRIPNGEIWDLIKNN